MKKTGGRKSRDTLPLRSRQVIRILNSKALGEKIHKNLTPLDLIPRRVNLPGVLYCILYYLGGSTTVYFELKIQISLPKS